MNEKEMDKNEFLEEIFGRNIENRSIVELDQVECSLIERVDAKSKELGVDFQGIASSKSVYLAFPSKVKDEFKNREKNFQFSFEERNRTLNTCIFKFLAYYDEYPKNVQNEVLNCVAVLSNIRGNSDNKRIAQEVIVDLVNFDWNTSGIKPNIGKVILELQKVVGLEHAKRELLKYYNTIVHTQDSPHVLFIKNNHVGDSEDLIREFVSAIGPYREIGCQNIGFDPETTAGSSRVYCNSVPGDLGDAIIRNNAKVVLLRNINDANRMAVAQLSAFFDGYFVDNFYRVTIPNDVIVICTESKSERKTADILLEKAQIIYMDDYTLQEKLLILENSVSKYNEQFHLEISLSEDLKEKLVEIDSVSEMKNQILAFFAEVSFRKEIGEENIAHNVIGLNDFEKYL